MFKMTISDSDFVFLDKAYFEPDEAFI